MAAISKRQQQRNERELQELVRSPGNDQCADCGNRNPSWASWNLGIFLCMRCASIHRKLGTHISKVKSLSMDTWTTEQVESMKRNGNVKVNKEYNPKNRKPDIPLDVDEQDSAMERFIRKKYQEKSLADGRPQVPARNSESPEMSRSTAESPPPSPAARLPSKKSKFFGFGLRASSSAFPLSKHDKKRRVVTEPRVDSAFRISADDLDSATTSTGPKHELSDSEIASKSAKLSDMGFTDKERNKNVLRATNGNVERAVERLIQMGPSRTTSAAQVSTTQSDSYRAPDRPRARPQAPRPATSTDAFDSLDNEPGFGVSFSKPQQSPSLNPFGLPPQNNNPWRQQQQPHYQPQYQSQSGVGLENSFHNMQISQPLFPHNTGGHPGQQGFGQHSAVPAMPQMPAQYMDSVANTNPFFASVQSPQSTGGLQYGSSTGMMQQPQRAVSNPFFASGSGQPYQQQPQNNMSSSGSNMNPFGTLQSQPSFSADSQQLYQGNAIRSPSGGAGQTNPFFSNNDLQPSFAAQPNAQPAYPSSSTSNMANFNYAQQQNQAQAQSQFSQFQPQQQSNQYAPNPFMQQSGLPQQQAQYGQTQFGQQQGYQQPQPQAQGSTLMPQQTGRHDKNSIMALYNYPQLAPQRLASIPEPTESSNFQQQQVVSPTPQGDIFGSQTPFGKRSATMPVSPTQSSSRNPFFNNMSGGPGMPMQQSGFTARHVSQDSMNVNNFESGRHSPDAFANLSARQMR